MPSECDIEKYMLVWLIRNTVRNKMGLPLTKYENTVPEKTQHTDTVKRLILDTREEDNMKNQIEQFFMLLNTNFTDKSFHVTLTYDRSNSPETEEEAKRIIENYIRRIKNRQKKLSEEPIKYILVTQASKKRAHHHIVLSCALSKDEIECMWKMGFINCESIIPKGIDMQKFAEYFIKTNSCFVTNIRGGEEK